MKGDARIIGISENESALHRWMVEGPEIGRMVNEHDQKYTHNDRETDRHHEQAPSTQMKFAANVKSVMEVIEDYDNPFTDDTADFVTFDTKVVLSDKIVESIRAAEEVGTAQYQIFVTDRLLFKTNPQNPIITICVRLQLSISCPALNDLLVKIEINIHDQM